MKRFSANASYILIHLGMWSVYSVIMSFATNFLGAHGISPSVVSVFLGVTAAASCLLQIVSGELVNRIARLRMYAAFLAVDAALAAGCAFMLGGDAVAVVGMVIAATLAQSLPAFANSVGMDAIAKGAPVNYSIARGVGSIAYAAGAMFMGKLIKAYSIRMVPIGALVLTAVLVGAVLWFHLGVEKKLPESVVRQKAEKQKDNFFKNNPRYSVFLIGAVLLCMSHFLLVTFMEYIITQFHSAELAQAAGNPELVDSIKGMIADEQGIATSISGYVELPVMFGFAWLSGKIRCDRLLRFSAIMFTVKALGLLFAGNVGLVYAAQATQIVGYGLYAISSVTYAGKVVADKDAVRAQSYLAATITAGSVIAMSTGGVLCDVLGVKAMILVSTVSAAAGAAIVFFSTRKSIQ